MAKPATNKPETTQAGNKPAGNKPAGNKPAQNKPAVNKPVDNKPTDDKPVDQKPTEKKTTEKKSTDKKPIDKKPTEKKPADNKPTDNKPTEKKTTEKKQTPKAVEPKKQVANDATKKEDKPVANAPKQQNQKRKREENGASAAHDVDKKLKPSTEAGVIPVHSGKRIVLFNLPEDATLAEVKALFPDPSKTPNVKFLSNANKERLGHANLFFTDDELYNQALAMTDLKIRDHEVSMRSEASIEKEKSVFASQFPRTIDENSVRNFFDGLEITFIYFLFSQTKITGSCIVEFADEAAKEAALAKSKTEFEGKKITVSSYETDRPKKEKAANPNAKKGKAPQAAKKGMEVTEEKSDKPQKQAPKPTQKPAAKKPVESKPSPAKNAKQNKTPAQKPNQTKPSPKKNNASPKPGAKTAAKPQKAAAKAQKKN